jgi:hypothetical protein
MVKGQSMALALDGIGWHWSAVATRKVPIVDDAKSFTAAANKVCSLSMKVILLTKKEIQKKYPGYHLHNARAMPGISKIHCVEVQRYQLQLLLPPHGKRFTRVVSLCQGA